MMRHGFPAGWGRWLSCGVMVLGLAAGAACASDHRDGPRSTLANGTPQGALDLNDLFVFVSPVSRNNTTLILTASPGAGVVGPSHFLPGADYEIRISNDGNPLNDEIVFQVEFQAVNNRGQQPYEVRRLDDKGSAVLTRGATTGRNANLRGGGKAAAGIFDDPFFGDVYAVGRFNREATIQALNRTEDFPLPPDITVDSDPTRYFRAPSFPNSFFAGSNTLAIALELPRTKLQSSRSNPNLTVWARSVADLGQGPQPFDRVGRPWVNSLLVPLTETIFGETLPGGFQDQFNLLEQLNDVALRPNIADRLEEVFGLLPEEAETIANLFLPDVVSFNATSRSGFPNGRRLTDDVTDTMLNLITSGEVTTDRVGSDSYFRRAFPYLGKPNPVEDLLP